MENRLQEALMNKQGNYIFPFFWMHGEDEQKIREYMEKIAETGIRAVCVESRPHPDFLGKHGGGIWISFWMRQKRGI